MVFVMNAAEMEIAEIAKSANQAHAHLNVMLVKFAKNIQVVVLVFQNVQKENVVLKVRRVPIRRRDLHVNPVPDAQMVIVVHPSNHIVVVMNQWMGNIKNANQFLVAKRNSFTQTAAAVVLICVVEAPLSMVLNYLCFGMRIYANACALCLKKMVNKLVQD
jgi:hypothetical protein